MNHLLHLVCHIFAKGESGSFGTPCDYYGRYVNTGVVDLDGADCLSGGYTQLNANQAHQVT